MEKHLILILVVCSGLFALIIHSLFSIPAPNHWFQAKWSAGEILTYVSTVSLFNFLKSEKQNIRKIFRGDFIAQCRKGETHTFDIVEGPMDNDTIWNYVNDYFYVCSLIISDEISNFNTDLYYQNPSYLEWSYKEGRLLE